MLSEYQDEIYDEDYYDEYPKEEESYEGEYW
jgi:hypothetical protein